MRGGETNGDDEVVEVAGEEGGPGDLRGEGFLVEHHFALVHAAGNSVEGAGVAIEIPVGHGNGVGMERGAVKASRCVGDQVKVVLGDGGASVEATGFANIKFVGAVLVVGEFVACEAKFAPPCAFVGGEGGIVLEIIEEAEGGLPVGVEDLAAAGPVASNVVGLESDELGAVPSGFVVGEREDAGLVVSEFGVVGGVVISRAFGKNTVLGIVAEGGAIVGCLHEGVAFACGAGKNGLRVAKLTDVEGGDERSGAGIAGGVGLRVVF